MWLNYTVQSEETAKDGLYLVIKCNQVPSGMISGVFEVPGGGTSNL